MTTTTVQNKPKRNFPFMDGILPIDRSRLSIDIVAGITLAALAIPEVMGYTTIAGMPVVTGLYTILIPTALFALFGSSRHLVVGADSATAAIMAAGLAGLAATGSSEYVAYAGVLALLAATFLILARLIKLGFLADFLSRTVLIGFLTGVGIQVAIGQISGMLGTPGGGAGPVQKLITDFKQLPETNLYTLAVSISSIGHHRRWPEDQQENPGSFDRCHRRDRGQLHREPCILWRGCSGYRPWRSATIRSALGCDLDPEHPRPTPWDSVLDIHRYPGAERRYLAGVCHPLQRELQRERRLGGTRPGKYRRRIERHVRSERQPDQDPDGRQRWRTQPAFHADHLCHRTDRSVVPDQTSGLHAGSSAFISRIPDWR